MDTTLRKQDHQEADPDQVESVPSQAAAEMSAFMASEEFAPFVLDCLTQAARDAVAEQTKLTVAKRRDE
jgi:hypothetical protein